MKKQIIGIGCATILAFWATWSQGSGTANITISGTNANLAASGTNQLGMRAANGSGFRTNATISPSQAATSNQFGGPTAITPPLVDSTGKTIPGQPAHMPPPWRVYPDRAAQAAPKTNVVLVVNATAPAPAAPAPAPVAARMHGEAPIQPVTVGDYPPLPGK